MSNILPSFATIVLEIHFYRIMFVFLSRCKLNLWNIVVIIKMRILMQALSFWKYPQNRWTIINNLGHLSGEAEDITFSPGKVNIDNRISYYYQEPVTLNDFTKDQASCLGNASPWFFLPKLQNRSWCLNHLKVTQ